MAEEQNFPIFFFSGTGNTWWVSEEIARVMCVRGFSAQAISMEKVNDEEIQTLIESSSIVGIGYPIYGSDAPLLVQDFIKRLPFQKTPKPLLLFVTQMEWSGNGAYFMHKELEKKGYLVHWAVEFKMPNNIGMHVFPLPSSPDYKKFSPQLEQATKKIEKLADNITHKQDWIQGKDLFNTCLSWIQRGPWRWALKWTQTHTWSVDPEKCSHCGRCVRICPVANIHLDENQLPRWEEDCNVCLRCFNYCPEQAVLVYKKSFNQKRNGIHPYHGPVESFKPELLISRKEKSGEEQM